MPRNTPRDWDTFRMYHGDGPWPCDHCGEPVLVMGRESGAGNIHHRDGNITNRARDNLAMMHHECHAAHHGSMISEELRHRRGSGHRDKPLSVAHRKKISASRTGVIVTEKWRRKLSESGKGVPRPHGPYARCCCLTCRREISINMISRHRCELALTTE